MRQIFPQFANRQLFLDKAYCNEKLAEELIKEAQITIYTLVKRKKGQADIGADGRRFSTAVSRVNLLSLFSTGLIKKPASRLQPRSVHQKD